MRAHGFHREVDSEQSASASDAKLHVCQVDTYISRQINICFREYLPTCLLFYLSFQSSFRKQLLERRDEFLDAVDVQPLGVGITRITKALRQRLAVILQPALPERFRWLDNKHMFTFHRITRLIL